MMQSQLEEWRPGSFTKNFSWGAAQGLKELYEIIRIGFAGRLEDTPRREFRTRVAKSGRPDYIPINFFLFNKVVDAQDFLLVDELVFQALQFPHSRRFDTLALYAFILSMVGYWKGAHPYQERPAMWAHRYVTDRYADAFNWDASKINADDIENFVQNDKRYKAQGARKLATNLNYLFKVGHIEDLAPKSVSRWWADAIFLTLDRVIESRAFHRLNIDEDKFDAYLAAAEFFELSGKSSAEKNLAARHVVNLYRVCGGRKRFSEESVRELTATILEDVETWIANNPEPIAAVHLTNPQIVKTIPRPCAMLAQSVGFQIFDLEELTELNISDLVRENLEKSLASLKQRGISPAISAEELMKLMRGE